MIKSLLTRRSSPQLYGVSQASQRDVLERRGTSLKQHMRLIRSPRYITEELKEFDYGCHAAQQPVNVFITEASRKFFGPDEQGADGRGRRGHPDSERGGSWEGFRGRSGEERRSESVFHTRTLVCLQQLHR